MTASERAALEALADDWAAKSRSYDEESAAPTKNDDERRTALVKFVTGIALGECAAALRLLSSPPPAERRCMGHCHCHAGTDGFMRPPCCDDCAAPDEPRYRDARDALQLTAAALRRFIQKDGHIERCGNGGEDPEDCSPNCGFARATLDLADEVLAAAPAPDEGRTEEKKLTHAASAPGGDLPTKGTDAGCDGEGSR